MSIRGVHLVGSFPLSSTEESIRTICEALGGHLRRIPDGEPVPRHNWAQWQVEVLRKAEPLLLHPRLSQGSPDQLSPGEDIDKLINTVRTLETGYDDVYLETYETFKRLRKAGVVPPGVKFQIGLPSPAGVMALAIRGELIPRTEPLYEAALLRSLTKLQDVIPHEDLAVQWDICPEVIMTENPLDTDFFRPLRAWFEPILEGVTARLVRLAASVDADVDVGFHLCYGDAGHKHVIEPQSLDQVTKIAESLLQQSPRPINWIHVPVPRYRTDEEYFQPLERLRGYSNLPELCLGLVHNEDLAGTQRRILAASKYVCSFSIATECGMGRTPLEDARDILRICAEICKPEDS